MIVCSCNVFTDADVRGCLSRGDGPRSAREVYGCLGCARKCGTCVETIRKIMEAEGRHAEIKRSRSIVRLNPKPREARLVAVGDCV